MTAQIASHPPDRSGRRMAISLSAVAGIGYTAAWIVSLSVGAPNPRVAAPGSQVVAAFAGRVGYPPHTIRLLADSTSTGGRLTAQRVTLLRAADGANAHHHAASAGGNGHASAVIVLALLVHHNCRNWRRGRLSEVETAAAAVFWSGCRRAARGVLGCPGHRGVLRDQLLPAGELPGKLGRPESGWGAGRAQRSGSGDTDLRWRVPVPLAAGAEEGSKRARRRAKEIRRCLKRYVASGLYRQLNQSMKPLTSPCKLEVPEGRAGCL